jgi:hypothetical protein
VQQQVVMAVHQQVQHMALAVAAVVAIKLEIKLLLVMARLPIVGS